MKEYTATELAYKNGYKDGYKAGVKEFAERLKEKCGYIAWDGISPAAIDNLVEEMCGKEDEEK